MEETLVRPDPGKCRIKKEKALIDTPPGNYQLK
jgi:hypothetical protein